MENKPILICNVSQSFFSVAQYSGGMMLEGEEYIYSHVKDVLIKKDWYKFYQRFQYSDFLEAVKSGIKPEMPKRIPNNKSNQQKITTPSLFD